MYELANSNLVDELFDAGILIITWGINPFSYPIYSCQSIEDIEPILGEPFGLSGKYTIRQNLHRFSIIPGHKLKKWSTSNTEAFPTMDILGEGNVVTLQPYSLRDKAGQSIIPSFALYRMWEASPVTEPLLNVNLLD
ncbi:MAG: hypothetical protein EOP45_14485 [Sphingobacteriaceae bacterium]|nr:MAG: hypothetical protein EOP45_14485 [Sphingobacteriaceae bacterium]